MLAEEGRNRLQLAQKLQQAASLASPAVDQIDFIYNGKAIDPGLHSRAGRVSRIGSLRRDFKRQAVTFRKVASLDDLWSGEMMGLDVAGNSILLVNIDDHIYAYADECPHQKSRLSEGSLMEKLFVAPGTIGSSMSAQGTA